MPYTITDMPTLGYDLARSPYGARAAAILRTALHADEHDLRRLARHRRRTSPEPHVVPADESGLARLSDAASDDGEWGSREELLHRLETAFLGSLEAADRMVRTEILDWVPRDDSETDGLSVAATHAADVLRDAVAPAFRPHSTAAGQRLAAGFASAGVRVVDAGVPVGHPEVDAFLCSVRGMQGPDRHAWRAAIESVRHTTVTWEPAMQQATHAVLFTNRVRQAADAQLAAVQAFHEGGFTPADATYGGWHALSGAVQALMVGDVLQRRNRNTLTRVAREVLG